MLAAAGSGPVWLGRRGRRIGRPVLCARPCASVLTSRPCAQFISLFSFHVSGGWPEGRRVKGRPPNGPLQTARPLRCGSLSDRLADEAASTDADVFSPDGGPFGPLLVFALCYATTSYDAATECMSPQVLVPAPDGRPPCVVVEGGRPSQSAPGPVRLGCPQIRVARRSRLPVNPP
jgi:hypothetical protein